MRPGANVLCPILHRLANRKRFDLHERDVFRMAADELLRLTARVGDLEDEIRRLRSEPKPAPQAPIDPEIGRAHV